jgi:hypothetical protein
MTLAQAFSHANHGVPRGVFQPGPINRARRYLRWLSLLLFPPDWRSVPGNQQNINLNDTGLVPLSMATAVPSGP